MLVKCRNCRYLVISISHFHGLQREGTESVDQVMQGHIIQVPTPHTKTEHLYTVRALRLNINKNRGDLHLKMDNNCFTVDESQNQDILAAVFKP